MAYVGDTGQGATISFSTTSDVGCVRSMDLPDWTMEKVDATCLDTTDFGRFVAGDLTDPGEITLTAVFDATNAIPADGVVETVTVTFPIGTSGNTTNATLVGSGFISRRKLPTLETNQLMELELTFAFDGDTLTPPTYTAEAA